MNQIKHRSPLGTLLLITALLLNSCPAIWAQAPAPARAATPPPTRTGKAKWQAFVNDNSQGWQWVSQQCTATPVTIQCAAAAVQEASLECGDAARFFKKGSSTWQWIGFSLILASAASTAVGASTTLANTKVWSTLGGTTGLGAVTTTINSNATGDQNAVASIYTTLDNFSNEVAAAGTDYNKVYLIASIYANKCAAIASSLQGVPPTPKQPQSPQLGIPGSPTITGTTAGTGQVTIVFTPASSGGTATSYTVSATPDGATVTGPGSPLTVAGLSNTKNYTFTVTATNSAGTGPPSAPSAPVKPN